jgi:coenzyme F420-reducing hydrogenase alpha subunit
VSDGGERTISVGELARVEGEGALHVRIRGEHVEDVRLEIFEPPRFFEALLRGRPASDAPDITSRICGICPIAYQVSACAAIEDALGIEIDERARVLRRLIYCGEWLESHSLHVFMLHAPDFLGYDGAIEMARDGHERLFEQGLLFKRAGNELLALVGGRSVHPVNLRVGGFHRSLRAEELRPVTETLRRARDELAGAVAWAGGLPFPDRELETEYASLRTEDAYPLERGELHSSAGASIGPDRFEHEYLESQVRHSTALHSQHRERGNYIVGPIARYSLNSDLLPTPVTEAARSAGLGPVCRNPFQSIVVRCVEMLYAADEALRLIDSYEPPPPAPSLTPKVAVGAGWSEAPRGMLWHRYELDGEGRISKARIVPPTSQNQAAIEDDLRELVQASIDLPDEDLQWRCEQAVRNYDPCISCSTHFLRMRIDRDG